MSRTRAGDAGFTLVEVLIAVTVFFIVFAAVMSLMLSVINTNVQAHSKTTVTNAANTYIERVRSMDFAQIGTAAGPPYGSLEGTTTVANGYTITITPQVTWVDDATMLGAQNYKKLLLTVSGSRAGGAVVRYAAETLIKKPDTGSNPFAQPPTIDFTASSPSDQALVEGVVSLGAVASGNGDNVTLTSMNFYCDGVPLQDTYGDTAQWALNAANWTQTFSWDTEADNEDDVPLSVDGWHTIKVECWDSNGRQSFSQRLLLVDNESPNAPGPVVVTPVSGANQLQVTWGAATDGNTTADHYVLGTWKQGSTATGTTNRAGWTSTSADYSGTSVIFAPDPFSRYDFVVRASNPTGDRLSSAVEGFGISRPLLSGTWRNNLSYDAKKDKDDRYTSTHTLALTNPSFPYASVTNTLYRSTSSAMSAPATVYTGSSFSFVNTTPETTGGVTQYYHQVKTVITPSGYNGLDSGGNPIAQTPITLWSNVVGPNAASGTGTGTQANVRW